MSLVLILILILSNIHNGLPELGTIKFAPTPAKILIYTLSKHSLQELCSN